MHRSATGILVPTVFEAISVEAFVPESLPPVPPLDMEQLNDLEIAAALALGRLDSVSTLLPDANLFIYSFVRREAVLSSQIEGTRSSISDLLLFELDDPPGVPVDDVLEVSNYVDALDFAMKEISAGSGIDEALLCGAHGILLDSTRGSDSDPGSFRRKLNWINGRHPADAEYVPPPPEQVLPCMRDLSAFIEARDGPHALVRAGMAHAQFETIHPFLDGNGRVGRLLISLILSKAGVLREPLLYLSLYLKQNRSTYYYLLNEVRREGEWEAWLRFFLEGVRSTAEVAVDMAQRLAGLIACDRSRIQNTLSYNAAVQAVHHSLSQRPIHSIRGLAEMSGLSWPTAASAVERLVELGIAREITGRQRGRLFAYSAYIDILNEGAEPL